MAMVDDLLPISTSDREILREVAEEYLSLCDSAANKERRERWYAQSRRECTPPLILTETGEGPTMVDPTFALRCEGGYARSLESQMREGILHHVLLKDDRVMEPALNVSWMVDLGNLGVEVKHEHGTRADGSQGSFHIVHPIKDLEEDLQLLKMPECSVDRELSEALMQAATEALGDLIPIRRRGGYVWTYGMTIEAIDLIGLEELMVAMYECPDELHALMSFMRDATLKRIDWIEQENLWTLNNENDYMGSGSFGYTHELPAEGFDPNHVRSRDLWALLESQETVGVGPDQFAEFIFPYQKAVAERFGLVYYGCCEPLHSRWHVIETMKNLRAVSISPWCDQEMMAEVCANGAYIYQRKPNPTMISTETFDEAAIREDLRKTMALGKAHNLSLQFSMKDVHTLHGEPYRLGRWVEIAREEAARVWG